MRVPRIPDERIPDERILDERSDPPLRAVIGRLLSSCHHADLALGRVRLGSLDLTQGEVEGPRRCRVLLGQLDASSLLDTAPHLGPRAPAMVRLAAWLANERLEVRSAGIGAWNPDFSVYGSGPGNPPRIFWAPTTSGTGTMYLPQT